MGPSVLGQGNPSALPFTEMKRSEPGKTSRVHCGETDINGHKRTERCEFLIMEGWRGASPGISPPIDHGRKPDKYPKGRNVRFPGVNSGQNQPQGVSSQ